MKLDALNAVCPYYTMYPLQFPLQVLEALGKPGQWVVDPFCGRGTTNFAARLLGMPSVGVDSSPVAAALAQAKLVHADPATVIQAAQQILAEQPAPVAVPRGPFWELAYEAATLIEMCRLREALLDDCTSPARVLLRAILLGALHGPRPKGAPAYFSNQSPRTFAPKPNYAIKFWTERGLAPERVDVLQIIATRATRYLQAAAPALDGAVQLADSRQPGTFATTPAAHMVVTSPPYYGMRTYLPDQWLRLWFLGGPDTVQYRQPTGQLKHTGAALFAQELRDVWTNVATTATDDARMVIRFGGIHDRSATPMDILADSLRDTGWTVYDAKEVRDADTGRRQVRQFQKSPRKGITEYDVYCKRV